MMARQIDRASILAGHSEYAGVGALAARSAVLGAGLNVRINAAGLKDRAAADALVAEADRLAAEAERAEREVLEIVASKI